MIKFSRSTNYPGSKVLYLLHYPLPYLKALKRKYISKVFQSNNQCNLTSKHLPADWFFKMEPPLKSLSARQFNYRSVYRRTSQSLYRYRASRRGKGKTNQERLKPKAETQYKENNNKNGLPRFSLLLKYVCCPNLVGCQKKFLTAKTASAKTTEPTTEQHQQQKWTEGGKQEFSRQHIRGWSLNQFVTAGNGRDTVYSIFKCHILVALKWND